LLLKKRILSIALSDAKFQRDEEEKKFEALVRRVDSKTSSLVKLEKNIAEIDKTIWLMNAIF
jgi:hypothetical protein